MAADPPQPPAGRTELQLLTLARCGDGGQGHPDPRRCRVWGQQPTGGRGRLREDTHAGLTLSVGVRFRSKRASPSLAGPEVTPIAAIADVDGWLVVWAARPKSRCRQHR